ncbi:PRD domain-containing protein [Corynebacterium silvaticum]|nr:CAT RNA binding domain-containing protein [Corynebacterium silvaticum]TFA92779.1 PRD domain-containing protein [Corynebacterium silvaticum]TFA96463.1 PRD domain-containing protein [Corynebacterium silvaticum]TNX84359.1 PRD domain-containing protein [Corynebacterium silvaticum]TRM16272.1 PRD domain-containing protein [Corynebacterium silvaticum]UWH00296.1 PRD domain-containing protein [Corynebacterium silvaticum]
MYRMQRRHNNNVVQAIDDHGRSVVLLGRGIGFGVSVGDSIDKTRIEMTYVLESQQHAASIAVRLSSLSPEILILTRPIVVAAHDRLGIDNAEALLLPVAEHMSFAVDRAGAGKYVDFPLETEIRHLFPKEYEFGQHVLKMIIAELGVSLPASEAAAFALHVVSMQFGRSRISRAVANDAAYRRHPATGLRTFRFCCFTR